MTIWKEFEIFNGHLTWNLIGIWLIPSKHLLVLKTSSRYALKTSSTRLQHNNLRLPRRLKDVLKTSWRHILKTCPEVVLKTCLEEVLKTYLEDALKTLWRQTKFLLGISVSNKSKCVSNKSVFHKSISDNSKANPKCIKGTLMQIWKSLYMIVFV